MASSNNAAMVHQYMIIQNVSEQQFLQQINTALQQGWQPVESDISTGKRAWLRRSGFDRGLPR
jgi:hypothetical protein